MQRRKLRAVALAAAAIMGLPQASAVADDRPKAGARFERLDGIGSLSGFKPAVLDADRRAHVIVELEGRSVGEVEARARGQRLSAQRKRSLRAELSREQAPVKSTIRSLGGQVLFDYQDAYNGVGARVPMSAVGSLEQVPGVAAVHPSRTFEPDNTAGVQFVRGNEAWADLGFTGEDVTVGIIDTGLDYLHANFGGAGDPAEFESNDGTVIEPGTFPTAKVVGGTDFVGDDYNASSDDPAETVPQPDPDPLDCNGHGSHVGGSAAGFGVLSDGTTFGGPYDGSTYSNDFRIGPGVAPEALIHAYRVFGCEGSVSEEVLVAAINRAVADGVDVVNMSIGAPFGRADEPSAEASDIASEAGTMIVASAGNDGSSAYMTGGPSVSNRSLSVAAIDASGPTLPGADIALSTGDSMTAINANEAAIPGDPLDVAVLRTSYPDGPVALGCEPAEYANYPGGVEGKFVVTLRGTCARVARAIFGEQAGAAAVAMINTSPGLPPFEGKITSNPDTGEKFTVTIPFLGIAGCLADTGTCSPANDSADPETLVAADGTQATLSATTVPNPGYKRLASFTSGGPRNVDSAAKPDVTAPGVSVQSTAVGTGNDGT
ncbi:MAG: S8 family serine peptidase, partial [Actinomycetota bacterium]